MLKILAPALGAALFAASTALFAQQSAPAPAQDSGKGAKMHRFDCSQAKDPKACEARREKARSMFKKAHEACDAKKGDERRDCMRQQMCSNAQDPAKCEANAKSRMGARKQAHEACKDKKGDELRSCMRAQRGDKK
jgi:Spy/CpxP family protein refolding chaperone